MEDGSPNTMNLDLEFGPVESPTDDSEPVPASFHWRIIWNLEDLLDGYRFREVVRQRRSRWRSALRNIPGFLQKLGNIAMEFIGRSESQTSEVVAEERPSEVANTCDNNNGYSHDEILGKKEHNEKDNSEEGGSFDCNICLDLSQRTCCDLLWSLVLLAMSLSMATSPFRCKGMPYVWKAVSSYTRRDQIHIEQPIYANLASAFGSGGRLVEPYFRSNTVERNQEQPLPVDDRDSVSSIAAVIHSESQTVDTAAEIDSRVSLSTSSSRRRK
ncbi:hypothetical protein HAX54_031934 [Datura stramonium]|uniref:Uncharacterized protein n=1 Tax=Datura stramonium TaxID=4076 RepID=A0ABS8SC99_DATST|nr:hypothetical protein [Datura stramonium]